ncbi:MAG: O-antigen polysaccharide polymerase Wzy family protein [Erysipelotrichaceae bacterium]|nr:O-antigen polysaccharide polymerase Wzy family protein [Erysipelotrichaceae bacterium]
MIKRQDILFICLLLIVGIVGIAFNNSISFFLAVIVFFVGFVYFLKDMNQNVFILVFLISFFTFLLGNEAICLLGIKVNKYYFPSEVNYHAYLTILVSLIFLFMSYLFMNSYLRKRYNNVIQLEEQLISISSVKSVSRIVFYSLLVFRIVVNLSEVIFTRTFSYSSLYTEYYFQGPGFFIKLADMSTIAFFVFLGTMPTKRECRVPVALFIGVNLITIFSGRRNDLIIALLIIIAYFCFRNVMYSFNEVWISKKQLIIMIIIAPIILGGLYMISSLREGNEGNGVLSYFDGITEFFYQQGFSINIIKWEKYLESSIPERLYSLGQTYEFFTTNNFISRLLFDFQSFSGQTVERALEGHRLSYLLSYLVFPWSYSQGYGVGSSYIAEAYHDFGYIGVAIFNTIYGCLFANFNYLKYRGPFFTAISLIMMQELLMAPRSYADAFIGRILDFSTIEILLVIWLISRYLNRRLNS